MQPVMIWQKMTKPLTTSEESQNWRGALDAPLLPFNQRKDSTMIKDFIDAMRRDVPPEARIMMMQFRGSPDDDIKGKWRAYVLNDIETIDQCANVYVCVSAMKQNQRGEFRRRKDNFSGGLLLMIDDIGSGKGAKFPMDTIDPLPPTALIETSKDNFQAIYMFDGLVTDLAKFEALIKAFIDKEFLGKDTGMAGVNRVFRPPAGINGKAKHNGWKVRLAHWHPEHRYTIEQIAEAYGLDLNRAGPSLPRGATADKAGNIRAFVAARQTLRSAGMLKNEEHDMGGWADVICPWTDEHTAGVDNGAAIKLPAEENSWCGGFKCHHGNCEHRRWRDLTDWLSDQEAFILEQINAQAGDWETYNVR
jgi:hypothetical protein